MKVTVQGEVRFCQDCKTEHFRAPCGLSYAERIGSQSVDTFWMPAKNASGKGYQRANYIDTQALKDTFGEDSRERMMDETHGLGPNPSPEQLRGVLDD